MFKQNLAVAIFFVLLIVAAGSVAYSQGPDVAEEPVNDVRPEGESFYGSAEGYGGDLTVEVIVDDGEIVGIIVTEHSETEQVAEPAFGQLADSVIAAQSTDVDTVSGATVTSEAFLEAVGRALDDMDD